MDYPPNSKAAADAAREPRKVEQVTSVKATKRRKPLGKQFKHTFIGGDAKTTVQYVLFDVVLPAAKDMLVDAGSQGIERLIYGDRGGNSRKAPSSPFSGFGHVAYNQISKAHKPQATARAMSSRARTNHDFGELVLESRSEATDVLDQMYDIISRYDVVTVANLYAMTGVNGMDCSCSARPIRVFS